MDVIFFCPDEPHEDHGEECDDGEHGHGQVGHASSKLPRDEEQERERREPGEVEQHLHQSEEDVVVLLVEAVPHVEWGIPLAVVPEWEPQPRGEIGGSHLGLCGMVWSMR